MDYLLIFALIFIAGTLLLLKTSAERHFIVFMIRTKYGLKLLDKAAKISPRLWRFTADFAVVLSFAGLGAWYIAKHRRIEPILFVMYLPAALIYYLSEGLSFLTIILLIILLILLLLTIRGKRTVNSKSAFALGFILFFLLAFKFLPELAGMGYENTRVTAPQIAHSILLIFVGITGVPALLIGSLVFQGFMIITEQSNTPGVSPILPSVKDGQVGLSPRGEGYEDFFIPIHYALIAIAVLLIVHEFAHGVLSRVEKIKVKSAGLLTLGPFPIGGFVEPDEEELKKGGGIKNMRISSMGSFANFVTAFVFMLLGLAVVLIFAFFVSSGTIEFDGVVVEGVVKGHPAYGVIENGSIIYEINNKTVTKSSSFEAIMLNITPHQNITITTDKGTFVLENVENPKNLTDEFLNIINPIPHTSKNPSLLNAFFTISELFGWISLLNLLIGLVNLLPIVPFDGGRMFNEIVNSFKINRELKGKIISAAIILGLFILLINILPLLSSFVDWIAGLILRLI